MTIQSEQKMYRVSDFAKKHNMPIGGLRHLIFFEKENGFHRCVRRIGRNVFILEHEFFRWVDEVNGINKVPQQATVEEFTKC